MKSGFNSPARTGQPLVPSIKSSPLIDEPRLDYAKSDAANHYTKELPALRLVSDAPRKDLAVAADVVASRIFTRNIKANELEQIRERYVKATGIPTEAIQSIEQRPYSNQYSAHINPHSVTSARLIGHVEISFGKVCDVFSISQLENAEDFPLSH